MYIDSKEKVFFFQFRLHDRAKHNRAKFQKLFYWTLQEIHDNRKKELTLLFDRLSSLQRKNWVSILQKNILKQTFAFVLFDALKFVIINYAQIDIITRNFIEEKKFSTLLTMLLSRNLNQFSSFDSSKNRHRIVCVDQLMLKFWFINQDNSKINSMFIMFVAMKSWRSKFSNSHNSFDQQFWLTKCDSNTCAK